MKVRRLIHQLLREYIPKIPLNFSPDSTIFRLFKLLFKLSAGKGHFYAIKLDVNKECNLKCRFCYIKRYPPEELELKYILDLIDSLDGGIIKLMGGEPLLRADILKIVRYAKRRGTQCYLFTNATLVSKELASNLKKAGLDLAIVTLTSDLEGVHDSLARRKGSWMQTIQGIKNLIGDDIKTYTQTVITSKNINRIKEINRFVKSMGATPLFFRYIPKSKNDPLAIKNNKKWAEVRRFITYEKSQKHGLFLSKAIALRGGICAGGDYTLSVKSNGDVTPCPFIDDLILGNIKKESIQEIFKNRFNNIEFLKFSSVPAECVKCSLIGLCKGGCKAANKTLFGDYNKKDYQCLGPWKAKPSLKKVYDYIPCWW